MSTYVVPSTSTFTIARPPGRTCAWISLSIASAPACGKNIKEADGNNAVVVAANAKTCEIRFESLHRQMFFLCGLANSRDRGGARVDGRHGAASACGLKCQIA